MKKILLTGFEPFGDYEFNPTMDLVWWNNQRTTIGNNKIIGIVLPCTYYGAFEKLSKIIDEEKPDAIISTGLSSSVCGIRIETKFRNLMNGKYKDADGQKFQNRLIDNSSDAKEFLISNAHNVHLANILHQNSIPVEMSNDADAFICNSLAYLTTQKILKEHLPIKSMFIHVPWTDDYQSKVKIESHKIFLEKDILHNAINLLAENI